jgi:cell division protein FtsW
VNPLHRARTLLFGSAAILMAIGIVMIYSASAIYAYDKFGDSAYFLKRHIIYVAAGCAMGWFVSTMDLSFIRQNSKRIMTVLLVMMVLVLIPGVGSSTGGARRWFKLLGFSLQPSEFLKIGLIVYLADFLERRRETLHDLKHTVAPALFVLGLCAGLVFLQPDLGTAVTLAAVALLLFFASGFSLVHLSVIILTSVPVMAAAVLAKPYRRKRMLAFFHPWDDPRGVGFQIIQSFLALGSGGIFGVGLGRSQQKLFYLPESHTDFIFAIIGEELGFIGTASVVVLFIVFIFSGMVIVFRSKDLFTQLVSLGLVGLIGFEAVINIGVSIGALPTKGLSLPFISYGGSALMANMIALGLLWTISQRALEREFGPPMEDA